MRKLAKLALTSGAALAAAGALLAFPMAELSSAATNIDSTVPSPFPTTPADQTHVTINVSGFTGGVPIFALECNVGSIDVSTCDGNTLVQANETGSGGAVIHYLLQQTSGGGATCDASDACVVWIGEDQVNAFTTGPHVETTSFLVTPGTAAPEAPFTVALPVTAVVIGGGAFFWYQRRRRHSAAA